MTMSNMTKNRKRIIIVTAIIFVVFSVIAFAVPFKKGGVFWVTYIFSVISLAVQPFVMHIAFDEGKDINSKLYGFPIARISVVYCIAQTVLSLVFMALGAYVPIWVVIVFDVLLLGAAAVGFIGADSMRDEKDWVKPMWRPYWDAMMKLIVQRPDLYRLHGYSFRDIHFRNFKRTGKNNVRLVSCEAFWPQGGKA